MRFGFLQGDPWRWTSRNSGEKTKALRALSDFSKLTNPKCFVASEYPAVVLYTERVGIGGMVTKLLIFTWEVQEPGKSKVSPKGLPSLSTSLGSRGQLWVAVLRSQKHQWSDGCADGLCGPGHWGSVGSNWYCTREIMTNPHGYSEFGEVTCDTPLSHCLVYKLITPNLCPASVAGCTVRPLTHPRTV